MKRGKLTTTTIKLSSNWLHKSYEPNKKTTNGALRLLSKIPTPQFWSTLLKVIWESAMNYPLKGVSAGLSQNEIVCLHNFPSWHLYCNHKQHLQRVRPRKKIIVFWKHKGWQEFSTIGRTSSYNGKPPPGANLLLRIWCSLIPQWEFMNVSLGNWLKHRLEAACSRQRTLLKGGRVPHPVKENFEC